MGSIPRIVDKSTITQCKPVLAYGIYPYCFVDACRAQAKALVEYVEKSQAEVVVVEETNLGKNRYSQKGLEFTHAYFLLEMRNSSATKLPVFYISSSKWRSAVGLEMSKEDRKNNAKLSKAKRAVPGAVVDKKTLGVKGKVTRKHLAVRKTNEMFQLTLKLKDNDIADSLLLGTAYFLGAEVCDGT